MGISNGENYEIITFEDLEITNQPRAPYQQTFEYVSEPDINDWVKKAACLGLTEPFFPAKNETKDAKEIREAKAKSICATCVVAQVCLTYAIDHGEKGIWGGTTEDERRKERKYQKSRLDQPVKKIS